MPETIIKKYESSLTNKTTPAMTDLLRLVGNDEHSYKALVSDVAKAIIETYAGSTVAGSAQSVKSALDALNSKTTVIAALETDLNNYTSSGIWSFDKLSSAMSHAPNTGTYFSGTLFVENFSNVKILQVFINDFCNVFIRYKWNSSTWKDWVAHPTRAEMDAVSTPTAITVTAASNAVIDVNKSYKIGKLAVLNIKGHTTAAINNAALLTFDFTLPSAVSGLTFFMGTGTEWNISGVAYGYATDNRISARVENNTYFHINLVLVTSAT